MATDQSSSAGYTAVAEAAQHHGATMFAQLFHPEVMDGQRGMVLRAVVPSDEPQERFEVVPEALSTAATNAQSQIGRNPRGGLTPRHLQYTHHCSGCVRSGRWSIGAPHP